MADTNTGRIVRTPGTCGGKARIAGHRVRVVDIVEWHEHRGMTADEIVSHYPSLSLAEVYAALAYYFDHLDDIQEEMRAERAMADEFRGGNTSLLDERLNRERLDEAS